MCTISVRINTGLGQCGDEPPRQCHRFHSLVRLGVAHKQCLRFDPFRLLMVGTVSGSPEEGVVIIIVIMIIIIIIINNIIKS